MIVFGILFFHGIEYKSKCELFFEMMHFSWGFCVLSEYLTGLQTTRTVFVMVEKFFFENDKKYAVFVKQK